MLDLCQLLLCLLFDKGMVWCIWARLRWTGDQSCRYVSLLYCDSLPFIQKLHWPISTWFLSGLVEYSSAVGERCSFPTIWERIWRVKNVCDSELCPKDGGMIVKPAELKLFWALLRNSLKKISVLWCQFCLLISLHRSHLWCASNSRHTFCKAECKHAVFVKTRETIVLPL